MSNTAMIEYGAQSETRHSLRDLLVVLFRRRWIVLGVSLPIIAFGVYGALTTIARFTAGSEVLIEARGVEDPSFQQRPVEYDIVMSTAAQIAQSIPVATKAADAMIDSLPALQREDEALLAIETADDLRDAILMNVNCGQIGESNLLSIAYTHENAAFALMVVRSLTSAFIEYNIEKGQNSQAVAYYDDQIAEAQIEIDDLMARRVAVFDAAGMNAFEINNQAGIQQMRALESAYHKARSTRMGIEQSYNGVMRAIAEDPDYMPSLVTSGKNANIVGARSVLDEAQLELARLRTTYQDDAQLVRRQLQYVEEARKVFLDIRADFVRDMRIDLDIARAEENSLLESLDQYRKDLLTYPALERELYTIELQIETKRDLLESLQTKRGEVRLKVQGDQRISNITQLNAPSIKLGVAGSKKILYLLVAAVLALTLGILVALLVDMQDHRIYDRRQAEKTLELPVLGSISPARISGDGQ